MYSQSYHSEPLLKRHFRDYTYLLSIAGIIVLLDQVSKYLVRTFLPLQSSWTPWPWLIEYARIVHWQNTGAAFGMFAGLGAVFTVLAIIVSIAIIYYFPLIPREDRLIRFAMGLQLGGALGNLVDRLTRGYVTDFISLGNFAVFNVADASITVGTILLILGMWLKERKVAAAKLQAGPTQSPSNPENSSQAVPEEVKGE